MSLTTAAQEALRGQLLDAAERVFYLRGIQAVNMSEVRAAADLPMRRVYQRFPTTSGSTSLITGIVTAAGFTAGVANASH
ncbi:hypothetical protein GCM10023322_09800 [Rugosimonospora acidiphila]|uniref:HTH tetR-type domain-containing protein n=1 Tax=Rugosimonospora acidiphila TaxID=556531 RepID=A0ABP9RKJ4_9ACTN